MVENALSTSPKEGSVWGMDWADITKAVTGKHWQRLADREERDLIAVVSLSGSLVEAKDLWKRLTEEVKEAELSKVIKEATDGEARADIYPREGDQEHLAL